MQWKFGTYTAVFGAITCCITAAQAEDMPAQVASVLERVRGFEFNPIVEGFSKEPARSMHDGVADLADEAWRVRTLAIRDLAAMGEAAVPALLEYLEDSNEHVRHVVAFALGFYASEAGEAALIKLLREDTDPVVRSQAAISLGQLKSMAALPVLQSFAENDANRDIRHQSALAAYRIETYDGPAENLLEAYQKLDESRFNLLKVGAPPPDFELQDTTGKSWRISELAGKKPIVLVWIFADWCPVCHNEFRELIHFEEEYDQEDVAVFTIECHDTFRGRVMTGETYRPDYWFAKSSPQDAYDGKRWWPHLVDPAGGVGAMYGVQPMQFTVHAEWINRPATIIIDKEGIVQFAYYGTFWGDRPSMRQTLEMIKSNVYDFEHPKRLK